MVERPRPVRKGLRLVKLNNSFLVGIVERPRPVRKGLRRNLISAVDFPTQVERPRPVRKGLRLSRFPLLSSGCLSKDPALYERD